MRTCLCLEPRGPLMLQSAHWVTAFSCRIDKLQRVFNAVARVITNTASMIAGYHGHCITTFTGWILLSGFSSDWLQQYTGVCTAWLQRTRGVQKVLQLDHKEEWKCYKLHFIFQHNHH